MIRKKKGVKIRKNMLYSMCVKLAMSQVRLYIVYKEFGRVYEFLMSTRLLTLTIRMLL